MRITAPAPEHPARSGRRPFKGPGLAAAVLLAAFLTAAALSANAQDKGQSWGEEKCARYTKAWSEALRRKGPQGLGSEFIQRHDAFLASGCARGIGVCPRSAEELEMANIMIIAAFNAGMASTFTPFTCAK